MRQISSASVFDFAKFTRGDVVCWFFVCFGLSFLEQSKAGIFLVKALFPTYYELYFQGDLLL